MTETVPASAGARNSASPSLSPAAVLLSALRAAASWWCILASARGVVPSLNRVLGGIAWALACELRDDGNRTVALDAAQRADDLAGNINAWLGECINRVLFAGVTTEHIRAAWEIHDRLQCAARVVRAHPWPDTGADVGAEAHR